MVRQPRSRAIPIASTASPPSCSAPKAMAMSSGRSEQVDLRRQRSALAGQPQRRQRPLAHDHRVHELDRHVAHVGARGGRQPERHQPPAAREALGHAVAQARQALGLALEEGPVGVGALGQRRVDATQGRVGADGVVQACTSCGAATRASQSRHASIPSPVRALTSMRSTSGCTASRL